MAQLVDVCNETDSLLNPGALRKIERKHFTSWNALIYLLLIPFNVSWQLLFPVSVSSDASLEKSVPTSSIMLTESGQLAFLLENDKYVPIYSSWGAKYYIPIFCLWIFSSIFCDLLDYASTDAETDLNGLLAFNGLKLEKFYYLCKYNFRLSAIYSTVVSFRKFLEYGIRIYSSELLSLYTQHKFLCQDGLLLGSERDMIKVNDLIVKSIPEYAENLVEILPVVVFLPMRLLISVINAVYRLQGVALTVLTVFFLACFICTLFVDKQSRMKMAIARVEPQFSVLLAYVISKWEEIEMGNSRHWFLAKLLDKLDKISRYMAVFSFYDALSNTVQYLAQSTMPILTSWLVHRYSLLYHYESINKDSHVSVSHSWSSSDEESEVDLEALYSGDLLGPAFRTFLTDNRKSIKYMGDGCQKIVDNYEFFEKVYAEVKTLRPLLSLLESHPFRYNPFSKTKNHISPEDGSMLFPENVVISFQNVYVDSPRKSQDEIPHNILKNLSFLLLEGENLLITGPSGIGKTTVFRALLKLWFTRKGHIFFKYAGMREKFLKLATMPILIPGTIVEQILYPRSIADFLKLRPGLTIRHIEAQISEVLQFLQLGYLLTSHPISAHVCLADWNTLSNGEKQRLQIARALLLQPSIVLMEESTIGIDHSLEHQIYEEFSRRKIQLFSVDNRQTVRHFFHKILTFEKDKSFTISLNQGRASSLY